MYNEQLRFKLQEELFKFLFTKGYPNLTHKQILDLVPEMWKHLDSKGLITPDMSYIQFFNAALRRSMGL